MSTHRRVARKGNVPTNYVMESSSEEEGYDEKYKSAKRKLKEWKDEDSDKEDPDFEHQKKKGDETSSSESDISDDEMCGNLRKMDRGEAGEIELWQMC